MRCATAPASREIASAAATISRRTRDCSLCTQAATPSDLRSSSSSHARLDSSAARSRRRWRRLSWWAPLYCATIAIDCSSCPASAA